MTAPLRAHVPAARRDDVPRLLADLLAHPVCARAQHPERYQRLERVLPTIRATVGHLCGWSVLQDGEVIRLLAVPAAPWRRSGSPTLTSPRAYACVALVLAFCEGRTVEQFLLQDCADTLLGLARDPLGVPRLDWAQVEHRRALKEAFAFLEHAGALARVEGDAEHFVEDHAANVLYRSVPGRYTLSARDGHDLLATTPTATGVATGWVAPVSPRQRLWRALLVGPGCTRVEDPEAYNLAADRIDGPRLAQTAADLLGWTLEVTAEVAYLVRPFTTGLGGAGYPRESGLGHLALLVARALQRSVARRERRVDGTGWLELATDEFDEICRHARDQYRTPLGATIRQLAAGEVGPAVRAFWRRSGLCVVLPGGTRIRCAPLVARFHGYYDETGTLPGLETTPQDPETADA